MKTQTVTSLNVNEAREPKTFANLKTHYDAKHQTAWCYMHAEPRPCFTTELLADLNGYLRWIESGQAFNAQPIAYSVMTSDIQGVYNLGGDLALFREHVQNGDRQGLADYAYACIDALHLHIQHCNRDLTTIAMVQGDALGGGFETALSADVIIAEKGSKLGLPEVLFNLFPGMGAYSLLSRKLDAKRAETMILSGRIYSAEELYDMGLVDMLAEPGEGELAVYDYIKRENRARNGFRAVRQVRDYCNPVTYQELKDITDMWVDAALRLTSRDLRMMERLVTRQNTKADSEAA